LICGLLAEGEESGDWLICMRMLGLVEGDGWGVEKAPVLCFCSFSKSSCSSLGRRGGAGPDLKDVEWRAEMLKVRRESWRGRRAMRRDAMVRAVEYRLTDDCRWSIATSRVKWCAVAGVGVVGKGKLEMSLIMSRGLRR
jgi:hypothetical protein